MQPNADEIQRLLEHRFATPFRVQISARRKTIGISIDPGGDTVTLRVPDTADPDDVVTVMQENKHRLASLTRRAQQYAPKAPPKELCDGTGFRWLGTSVRLKIVSDAPEPVQRAPYDCGGSWVHMTRAAARSGARPLINWYVREGSAWLRRYDPSVLWGRTGSRRPMPTVRAADIGGKRWGVYNAEKHEVRIAWQVFQLTPQLVLHVVMHELTHATLPPGRPHGPAFWNRFEAAWPGARKEADLLAKEGSGVWMGAVVPLP